MLEHGGGLRRAATQWGITLADWIDLSTGINPHSYPLPALDVDCWRRLPEEADGLEAAAAACYGNERLLPLPGSQAGIQLLPTLFPRAAIACLAPLYNEHPAAWARAGHKVRQVSAPTLARALAMVTPYLLLCNPNNPSGRAFSRTELLDAAAQLARRGGALIVDEAFIDATPEESVAPDAGSANAPNLVVLRSLGKFYGLAGARVGFVLARPELLARLREALGPWAVSGPGRAAARFALADKAWQGAMRGQLMAASERLAALLAPVNGGVPPAGCALFRYLPLAQEQANGLADFLAARAILVRRFAEPAALRFGLPADAAAWTRLQAALDAWKMQ